MLVFMLSDFNRAVYVTKTLKDCVIDTMRLDRAQSYSTKWLTKNLQLREAIVDDVMVLEMEELVKVL